MDDKPTLTAKEVNKLWLDILQARAEIQDYTARAEDAQRQLGIAVDKLKAIEPDIEDLITERLDEAKHPEEDKEDAEPRADKVELTEDKLNALFKELKPSFIQGDVMKLVTPLKGSIKQFVDHYLDKGKIQYVSGKGNGRLFKKI